MKFVQEFCADNALTLNLSKCEVLAVSPTKPPLTSSLCTLDNQHPLIPRESVKCLGYWRSWDLSSVKSIHEAIPKARRALFAFGALGAFKGKLNPLIIILGRLSMKRVWFLYILYPSVRVWKLGLNWHQYHHPWILSVWSLATLQISFSTIHPSSSTASVDRLMHFIS